ncbi:MAG TPA: hypothetical protein VMV78_13200, partial [Thiobacillus sp.]|nr:hypothetical protein [Thiobacillus sp.]
MFAYWLASGDNSLQQALLRLEQAGVTAEPMGFPNVTDSDILMSGTTFTIQPASGKPSYSVWVNGRQNIYSGAQSINASGSLIEGTNFFFYGSGGTLQFAPSFWDLSKTAPVAAAEWNVASGQADLFFEERHGLAWPWPIHEYMHLTVGMRFATGLGLTGNVAGNGSADSHAQVAIEDGRVYDEDIKVDIVSGTSASRFAQRIAPQAYLPVLFRLGANGPWRKKTANSFPLYENTGDEISYNLDTAGTWSIPPATNTNYVAMWIFATNNFYEPVVAVMGQRQDTTLANAQNNNTFGSLAFGNFPFAEAKILYRLIFQTSAVYGNTPKARLRDIADLRSVSNMPAGTYVATDHNSLTGRSTFAAHPAGALSFDGTAFSGTLAAASGSLQEVLRIIDQILVQSSNIASGQIGSPHLADGAVLSANIASGQVSSAHFASGTILPPASGSIVSGMLGNGSVVSGNIASGSVGLDHLASGVLTNIFSGVVGSGDLGAGAVLSANIASGQISSAHFASGTIMPPGSGSITSSMLASGTIIPFVLTSGIIGSGLLGDGAVVSGSIASGQVSSAHFASGTILPPGSGSITSSMLASGTVIPFVLTSGAIVSGLIGNGA